MHFNILSPFSLLIASLSVSALNFSIIITKRRSRLPFLLPFKMGREQGEGDEEGQREVGRTKKKEVQRERAGGRGR